MTNKLILTRGIPGSGKTTWAKAWVEDDPNWRVRVNRDDLRMLTYGKYVLDRHQEETLSAVQHAMVETALRAKQNVVVDDTNLTAKFVKEWLRLALTLGVEVEFKDFDITLDEALKRNKLRAATGGRDVPEDVIKSFYSRFVRKGQLAPQPQLDTAEEFVMEPYVAPHGSEPLPQAWIVDIDGTLADMGPCGREPFDWSRVGEDEPIESVIALVSSLEEVGYTILFMSGRDAVCRQDTVEWLQRHVTFNNDIKLFMRPEKDGRKDNIVKYELFNQHVRGKYHVMGVIDDRQQVVDMWRKLGLVVAQVAEGDF